MTSILIVEDHQPASHLRSRVLRDAGSLTEECATARAALSRVLSGSTPPAAVLLDVRLPDGNGLDVCERLKVAQPKLPVALISAVYRTSHARRDAMWRGADAYLLEPLAPGRLVQAVQNLVSPGQRHAPAPAVVRTVGDGVIVSANKAAAILLNLSPRGTHGRSLLPFFNDRTRLRREVARAQGGQVCDFTASLSPRERRPLEVHVDLALPADGAPGELEWIVESAIVPTASPKPAPAVPSATAPIVSQTLWHAHRRDSPPATAVVTRAQSGQCELRITIGEVARQQLTFNDAMEALGRAERLLLRLESVGYHRVRRDRDARGGAPERLQVPGLGSEPSGRPLLVHPLVLD